MNDGSIESTEIVETSDFDAGFVVAIDGAAAGIPDYLYKSAVAQSAQAGGIYNFVLADMMIARVSKNFSKAQPWVEFRIWSELGPDGEGIIRDFGDRVVVIDTDGHRRLPRESVVIAIEMAARLVAAKGWNAVRLTKGRKSVSDDFEAEIEAISKRLADADFKIVDQGDDGTMPANADIRKSWQVPFWLRQDTGSIDEAVDLTIRHFPAGGEVMTAAQIADRQKTAAASIALEADQAQRPKAN